MNADRANPIESRLAEILRTHDVACVRCGYNLRGLDPGGRCPECGTPVDQSVASPLLERVDPRWVRRTAHGTLLVGAGLGAWVVTVGVLAAMAIALVLILAFGGFTGWSGPSIVIATTATAGAGTGFVLVLAGMIFSSTPNRAMDGMRSVRLWRRGVRMAVATWAGAIVLGGLALLLLRGAEVPERALFIATDLYFPAIGLGSLAVVAVFVGYVGELLTHAPDAGLGRRCARRTRLLVACVLVALFGFLLANTLIIPLGVVAQGTVWAVTIGAGACATFLAGWLAQGITSAAHRFARCAGDAAEPRVDQVAHPA